MNLGECPEWIDGLETCATPGQGATPAQQDELADRLRAQAAIHLDSRGRRRTGELLLDAADALTAAKARIRTLEAECLAWRKGEDWMWWDIGEPNDFATAKREFDEAQRRLDAARAATGPIGGVH